MDHLEMAKQLLGTCAKTELRDDALGNVEITWYNSGAYIAYGYFSESVRYVGVNETTFVDEEADELRKCFAYEQVETVREEATAQWPL